MTKVPEIFYKRMNFYPVAVFCFVTIRFKLLILREQRLKKAQTKIETMRKVETKKRRDRELKVTKKCELPCE